MTEYTEHETVVRPPVFINPERTRRYGKRIGDKVELIRYHHPHGNLDAVVTHLPAFDNNSIMARLEDGKEIKWTAEHADIKEKIEDFYEKHMEEQTSILSAKDFPFIKLLEYLQQYGWVIDPRDAAPMAFGSGGGFEHVFYRVESGHYLGYHFNTERLNISVNPYDDFDSFLNAWSESQVEHEGDDFGVDIDYKNNEFLETALQILTKKFENE